MRDFKCKYIVHRHRGVNTFDVWVNSSGSQRNSWIACGFAWEFLHSGLGYRPGRSVKKQQVLQFALDKKIFGWGVFFCEWCHKWTTFWPTWPNSPGPGRQTLDGSISLKILLETRLQSESFDTLDDLLGFRVQKLWFKLFVCLRS